MNVAAHVKPRGLTTGRTFENEHISLTGGEWVGCLFKGCIVEVSQGLDTRLEANSFIECYLIGDGWPSELTVEVHETGRHGSVTFN